MTTMENKCKLCSQLLDGCRTVVTKRGDPAVDMINALAHSRCPVCKNQLGHLEWKHKDAISKWVADTIREKKSDSYGVGFISDIINTIRRVVRKSKSQTDISAAMTGIKDLIQVCRDQYFILQMKKDSMNEDTDVISCGGCRFAVLDTWMNWRCMELGRIRIDKFVEGRSVPAGGCPKWRKKEIA